jgi:uncharacterized protein YpmS
MKWFKRLLYLVALSLVVLLGLSLSGVYLYRGTPGWYRPRVVSTQETRDAANRADQKILDLFSWAASAQAQERRHQLGKSSAGEVPIGPKTVSFDEEEINSFIATWKNAETSDIEQRISRYFTDGRIVFEEDSVILAGESPGFGTVVSAEFSPSIDETGLHLDLSSLSAGRLPIPKSAVAGKMKRLEFLLEQQLLQKQPDVRIDESQTANGPAVAASWIEHLLAAMNEEPTDPTVIIPFDMTDLRRGLPVKVTGIKVVEGSISLTLETVSASEENKLANRLKQPWASLH